MSEPVNVGVAEMTVSPNSRVLASYGLGSCVAVAMFDPLKKVGGLAHVMLPDSRGKEAEETPGKFADVAIPMLIEELVRVGARRNGIRCKIAGGSQMFEIPVSGKRNKMVEREGSSHIGERNVEGVKKALADMKIPLVGEDTGGNYGRTVKFNTSSGELEVSSIHYGRIVI